MRVIVVSTTAGATRDRPSPAGRADPGRRRRRRERGHRAQGLRRDGRATRRAWSPACCCPMPRSWPGGRAPRPTCLPAPRSAASRSAGSPMPRAAADPRGVPRPPGARPTRRATPTSPGPGSPSGGRNWPRCSTSRRTSPITAVEVRGASDSPSTTLLAAWLQLQLQVPADLRARLRRARRPAASTASRWSGPAASIDLERTDGRTSPPSCSRPADARHLAAPAQSARLPRRRTAQARPRRPVRRGDPARARQLDASRPRWSGA